MVAKANVSLQSVYEKYSAPDGGGDKGTAHTYIDIYEKKMTKTSGISLLEIGVWEGHSLAMWEEYFKDSTIWGIDIKLDRLKYSVPAKICDATDAVAIENTLGEMQFDYIIDDGSHLVQHQVTSRQLLWKHLKVGGKYFIEDIVSDAALRQIEESLFLDGLTYEVYDYRYIKKRSDDILVVIHKVE